MKTMAASAQQKSSSTKAKAPGVLVFSGYGLNCEEETKYAFELAGGKADIVHINDIIDGKKKLADYDILAFPGGFSYGDDTGSGKAFANKVRNHLWKDIEKFMKEDKLVIGICNGFQVLTESHLLPGALMRNAALKFVCKPVAMQVEETQSGFTRKYEKGQRVTFPVAHGEGSYFADDATLDRLEGEHRVAFRYARGENPNGSARNIAGILSEKRNVLGLMPHPERVVDDVLGGTDGRNLFQSLIETLS